MNVNLASNLSGVKAYTRIGLAFRLQLRSVLLDLVQVSVDHADMPFSADVGRQVWAGVAQAALALIASDELSHGIAGAVKPRPQVSFNADFGLTGQRFR